MERTRGLLSARSLLLLERKRLSDLSLIRMSTKLGLSFCSSAFLEVGELADDAEDAASLRATTGAADSSFFSSDLVDESELLLLLLLL